MNRQLKRLALLVACLAWGNAALAATPVRGRVDYRAPQGYFPMANAQVAACWAPNACLFYLTGYDGMFYFVLNPGQYVLYVNGQAKAPLNVPDSYNYDVPPLLWN